MFKVFKTPAQKKEAALRKCITYLQTHHVINVLMFLGSLPVAWGFLVPMPFFSFAIVTITLCIGINNKNKLTMAKKELELHLQLMTANKE